MITFNNIVERFEIFATNHFFIKSFSFGSPDDVDLSKFQDFPLMHLVYTGATYDAGTKTYNLEVYILDVPNDKKGKVVPQKEAISDAEQCAEDILADIKNGGNIFLFAQDYEVVNATTTPLEEETKNVLSGVLLDLSVSIPYEWDACNAPIDGVAPGGGEVVYARRGILRMLTIDGATDVQSVRTIKVTNGTLTDDGDGVVILDTGGAESLNDLSDVFINSPVSGQILKYNAVRAKWQAEDNDPDLGLDDLNDVNTAGKSSGSLLRWDGSSWGVIARRDTVVTEVTGQSPIFSTEGETPLISIAPSSSSNAGSMSAADKSKLDLIQAQAQVNAVDSVNTQVGDVVLDTDDIAEGTTNEYFTDARVEANSAVAANTAKNSYPSADASKLAGIEDSADVTDATNVTAAGAVMKSAPQIDANLDVQANEITSTTTDANITLTANGTGFVEVKGNTNAGAIRLNCESNTHGVTIKSPPHSANATYDLTLPVNDGDADQVLQTDGNGVLSWVDQSGGSGTAFIQRYLSEANTLRSGATATTEIYFTATAEGNGLSESASSDTPGTGNVINRKIYYSETAFADPDTGTWVEFTPAPADDATFATVKAALFEYLKVRTGGTIPISLKQTWVESTPSTLLLDQSYASGAEAAYSTRQLRAAQTDCMVIKRASDSTTTTIGFDVSGNIDESAINSFCSGTTCTVQTWKDQSGNGNDATQSTTADQPTIYTGGAIVKNNGKAILQSNSFTTGLVSAASGVNNSTFFGLIETNPTISKIGVVFNGGSPTSDYLLLLEDGSTSTSFNVRSGTPTTYVNGITASFTRDSLFDFAANGSLTSVVNYDGSGYTYEFGWSTNTGIGMPSMQEAIIYASDKSTDRTSIESNMGDYFTQNTPLLDTYTTAGAAFSLRKLRSDYSGSAIRIRRSSDNTEQDIGFNIFGEVDSVSILAFANGGDAFVKTWYNQVSGGNDATQTTTSQQPKIVDSGALITSGGKVAMDFDGSNDKFSDVDGLTINTNDCGAFVVCEFAGSGTQYDAALNIAPDNNNEIVLGYRSSQIAYCGSIQGSVTTNTAQNLCSVYADNASSDVKGYYNQVQTLSDTPESNTSDRIEIANVRGVSYHHWRGTIQEVIFFPSSTKSDHSAIENSINSFYSLF